MKLVGTEKSEVLPGHPTMAHLNGLKTLEPDLPRALRRLKGVKA